MKLQDVMSRYPGATTFIFGDSRALCDDFLALVRAGKKRATCAALREYEAEREALPVVGRQDIALDWDNNPALVIETTEVTIRRFCDVDADFALAEGENDSLAGWQRDHSAYFARNGGFDPEMDLVCERFRLVADFGQEAKR